MSNLLNLIWNEQVKLYAKKGTWIMFAILLVIAIGGGLITKFTSEDSAFKEYGDNWQVELQEENAQMTAEMQDEEFGGFMNEMMIEENNYHLENDIKPTPYDGWEYVLENSFLTSVISLFTIIVAAGIVSNEFKWGTIKLLLIRPISRTKILLSKYVSVLIFAFTLLVFLLFTSWVVGALLFGLNGMNPVVVQDMMPGYVQNDVLGEIAKSYGFSIVTLIMMATFAFMISAIFRSSGMAIGLAIFLMMAGNAIVAFLAQYEWSKYILFANTNLKQYLNDAEPMIPGMSMTFSIIVLLVYFVIFIGAAWAAFTKRDVAGN